MEKLIQQIEILHYIDFVRKRWSEHCCVSWGCTGITSQPHPSDQHVVHYITIGLITNIFGKFLSFLQTCDFIKYIMQYNSIWVMEKIQSASSYTWQNEIYTTLLLECHYQSLLSVCNNFWLWSNVDFGLMMRQNMLLVTL